MNVLHLSALPVWPIEGKGGMPSLRETLHGHVRGGHEIVLILPKYQVFSDTPKLVSVQEDEPFPVVIAGCAWAPLLLATRRLARRISGGKELLFPLRWLCNMALLLLLTASLALTAWKVNRSSNFKFDLVYAHNQYAALAGWLVGLLLRVPNVTRLYGTFLADLMKKPLIRLRYPTAVAGFLVPHSLLICGNDGTRGDEVARRPSIDLDKFRFWQNGVDLPEKPPSMSRQQVMELFRCPTLREDSSWILSCSRLSYWKRIDRMLEAVAHARSVECDC